MSTEKRRNAYKFANPWETIKWTLHQDIIELYRRFVNFICVIIYYVTFERDTKKLLTLRKAKRIRMLTKFKLWGYRHFKSILDFLGKGVYLESIHKRFET